MDRPERGRQRAPARVDRHRAGLGDGSGRRRHERARMGQHRGSSWPGTTGEGCTTTSSPRRSTAPGTGCACRRRSRAPTPGPAPSTDQTLSFDAYLKFIEDDFLGGERLDPATDGRPDSRPDVRENDPALGNLLADFDFSTTAEPAADPAAVPPVALPSARRRALDEPRERDVRCVTSARDRRIGGPACDRNASYTCCSRSRRWCVPAGGRRERPRPVVATCGPGPDAGTLGIGDGYYPRFGNGGYDVQHYDLAVGTAPGRTTSAGSRRSRPGPRRT